MRIASVLVIACCAFTSGVGARVASSQPDPAITGVADAYVRAVVAKDAKALAALYTEDAVEMPPNEPLVKGRAAIEEYYAKLFAGPGPSVKELVLTHLESTVSGDTGFDVGTYRETLDGPAGSMNGTGKYVVVLKRRGAAWKVAYAIYSGDQPPPSPMPSAATPPKQGPK